MGDQDDYITSLARCEVLRGDDKTILTFHVQPIDKKDKVCYNESIINLELNRL